MSISPNYSLMAGLNEVGMVTPALLMLLYIVSFYAFMDNSQLSLISFGVGAMMFGVLSYRHLLVRSLHFPRLFLAPWVFLLLNIVSLFWAQDTTQAIDELKAMFSAIMAASAIWLALLNGVPVRIVLLGLVIGSLVVVGASYQDLSNFGGEDRLGGLVGNANEMAIYLSYPLLLAWVIEGKNMGRWRLLCGALVVFAFLYSGSRIMLLVLAVQVAFLLVHFLTHFRNPIMWRRLGLSFAVLVLVASFQWSTLAKKVDELLRTNQVLVRFEKLDENRVGSSVYIREKMVSVGLQLWAEEPIVGHGAGQFTVLSGFSSYSHNNYIELLSNDGIIGLALYYAIPVSLVFLALKPRWRTIISLETRVNVILAVLALNMLDLTVVSIRLKGYWVLLVALAAVLEREERVNELP